MLYFLRINLGIQLKMHGGKRMVKKRKTINSIQLVTSYYHMPRGVTNFEKVFPDKNFRELLVI